MTLPRISVVGLGRLGGPMAACFAGRGFEVTGVDHDPCRLDLLRSGASHPEPGVAELVRSAGARLRLTADLDAAVRATDITFVIVATPTDAATGEFSLRYVLPACESIGRAVREKERHLVVISSTVMPGAIDESIRPLLETASGRPAGEGFSLCYSPEFVALGSFVRNYLNPDFVMIGQSDEAAGERLAAVFQQLCENDPVIHRTTFRTAEVAKLALNAYVASRIGFANLIGRICRDMPGADPAEVTRIIGSDARIGSRAFRPGMPFGGPCFPRDVIALEALARRTAVGDSLVAGVRQANASHLDELHDLAVRSAAGGTIGILGLTFKPDTDVLEGSPGMALAERLAGAGIATLAWDPVAADVARTSLGATVTDSLDTLLIRSTVVLIATPWPELENLGTRMAALPAHPHTVIDPWRIVASLPPDVRVLA